MAHRDIEQSAAARAEFDAYIRSVAASTPPAAEGAPAPPPTS
jgi:hypothetical protein